MVYIWGDSTILLRAFRGSKGWEHKEIQRPSARPGSPQLHSHHKKERVVIISVRLHVSAMCAAVCLKVNVCLH